MLVNQSEQVNNESRPEKYKLALSLAQLSPSLLVRLHFEVKFIFHVDKMIMMRKSWRKGGIEQFEAVRVKTFHLALNDFF